MRIQRHTATPRTPRRIATRAVTHAAALTLGTLAACGSGGGDAPTTPTVPVTPVTPPTTVVSAVRNVSDPGIAKENGVYVVMSTGPGIPIRRSRDLMQWDAAGQVFASGLPPNASTTVPGVQFPWAPDLSYFNGSWHLYYALSTFGSQRSAIALATSPTLDPAVATTRWTDQGVVLQSVPGSSTFNAIDPNVAFDAQGAPWLSWGSFWGGIKLARLDASTGRLSTTDATVYSLAARQGTSPSTTVGPSDAQAIEAPYIVRHNGYFYLFASYDLCCRGTASTYNVRVGRATQITGPYLDMNGTDMAAGGGTPVLVSTGTVRGPGGESVLVDGDQYYLVHHFYDSDANGTPTLQTRPITWDARDWPTIGAPLATPNAGSRAPAGQPTLP